MRTFFRQHRAATLLAILFGVLAWSGSVARALDFDDLVSLIENGVPESSLVGILRDGGGVDLDDEDERILRQIGASEQVISLARGGAVSSPTVVTTPPVASAPVSSLPTQAAVSVASSGAPVTPLPVSSASDLPALYSKEGWLSVGNQDHVPYYLAVNRSNKRMFLSRTPNGGYEIHPGQTIAINIRKETYKMYGDSGRDLKIRVREGELTTLRLVPYGVVGNSGLQGVVQDRERVRNEVLFSNYVPAPQVVVVEEPPVIVVPSPAPRHYYYYHEPRPYRRYHRGGSGFSFRYGW